MESNEFGIYLRNARKNRKLTTRQVELYSGVSNAYLSQVENGKRGIPSPTILQKLSSILQVPYEELMQKAGYLESYSRDNIAPFSVNDENLLRIPILGSIRAGQPVDRIELVEGYELAEKDLLRGRDAFILRVQGDSMIGDYIFDGDRVVVVVQPEVSPSDIAVVAVNGHEATLKRVKYAGDICILMPSNTAMEPMTYEVKDVHIIGKVIESRRRRE